MKRALLAVLVGAAAFVALAFLVLPVVAIFLHTTPGHLVDQLSSSVVEDAFVVTLETTLIAQALIVLLGTPTAYLLATRRFRARPLAITLVELPLVLPPPGAGVGRLSAIGRSGRLGPTIPFTKTAVVMAVAFVSSPLYVRQAIAAFETVDPDLVAASRTLGSPPAWRSRSPAASASSARRSCSPAASRGSRRPCRSRSTPSSAPATSTRPSP